MEDEELYKQEDEGFGECEECGRVLFEEPPQLGFGYVCIPCAKKMNGEYEL